MIVFVFPGQGAQRRGMGGALFDEVPEYVSLEPRVDTLLGYSLRALCRDDPGERLRQTQYTQPALFTVNALHALKSAAAGVRPQYLAGHSLGEYNALFTAGAFDFLTGLSLVKKRGELMARAANGAMAAVVGLRTELVTQICTDRGFAELDVANFNSPSQTVLSGPADSIKRAAAVFESAGAALYAPLPVSGAFHSRYMADAAAEFANFLEPLSIQAPRIPVMANASGEPYPTDQGGRGVKALLVRQISQPVQWMRCIRYLLDRGVTQFTEQGPGNVLSRLIEQTRSDLSAGTAASPGSCTARSLSTY